MSNGKLSLISALLHLKKQRLHSCGCQSGTPRSDVGCRWQ